MRDRVLLSAGRNNAAEAVALAVEKDLGIEVMAFAFPDVLDGDWQTTLAEYKRLLAPVPGKITLHGPFMDMASGSPDPRINAVSTARYRAAIHIAAELGAPQIVLHANFIGSLHNDFYRQGWHQRNLDFWPPLISYAYERGVRLLIENMWEFDPTIIADLLEAIDHPNFRACLDVGHAHIFGAPRFSWDDWLRVMAPWVDEFHMNNNNGILDEHHGFDWSEGVLDYHALLPGIRAACPMADLVMEMDRVSDMRASLHYFRLSQTASDSRPADRLTG